MFAVFATGGKQYRVRPGDEIYIEKLPYSEGETVTFGEVLALETDGGIEVGAPYIEGAEVTAEVLKTGKGKKITVFTYKPKKGSARKKGHRQPYSKVKITAVGHAGDLETAPAEPVQPTEPTEPAGEAGTEPAGGAE